MTLDQKIEKLETQLARSVKHTDRHSEYRDSLAYKLQKLYQLRDVRDTPANSL